MQMHGEKSFLLLFFKKQGLPFSFKRAPASPWQSPDWLLQQPQAKLSG